MRLGGLSSPYKRPHHPFQDHVLSREWRVVLDCVLIQSSVVVNHTGSTSGSCLGVMNVPDDMKLEEGRRRPALSFSSMNRFIAGYYFIGTRISRPSVVLFSSFKRIQCSGLPLGGSFDGNLSANTSAN